MLASPTRQIPTRGLAAAAGICAAALLAAHLSGADAELVSGSELDEARALIRQSRDRIELEIARIQHAADSAGEAQDAVALWTAANSGLIAEQAGLESELGRLDREALAGAVGPDAAADPLAAGEHHFQQAHARFFASVDSPEGARAAQDAFDAWLALPDNVELRRELDAAFAARAAAAWRTMPAPEVPLVDRESTATLQVEARDVELERLYRQLVLANPGRSPSEIQDLVDRALGPEFDRRSEADRVLRARAHRERLAVRIAELEVSLDEVDASTSSY